MYDSHIQLAKLFARCTVTERGCWEWDGPRSPNNYPRIEWSKYAHRVVWEATNGPIPPKILVCHHCDNPPCVNPNHLFLGTHKDNQRDAVRKGRTARGDANGSRLYPERRPRGERNGARLYPERLNPAKGDANGSHTHPERRPRGERNGQAKLTDADVSEVRSLYATGHTTYAALATKFNISIAQVGNIVTGKQRKEASE